MIDNVRIRVKAGDGGAGAVTFRRERYIPRGGPDGGDGGHGGDVVLLGDASLDTLSEFRTNRLYKAEAGGPGQRNLKHGANGADLVLRVPPGTVAFRTVGDEEVMLGEVLQAGQQLIVAAGGKGGRGNKHFATAVHQVPKFAEQGGKGEEATLRLELRLLADAGLVGLPNAGKSTLLARASAANPLIGAYPFTTLEPVLGVVELGYERFVMADIPGLIEGASHGAGLGHDFLRHIMRTRVLVHVLDGSAPDPVEDARQVLSEMEQFDPALVRKPRVLVINKIDLPGVRERLPELRGGLGAAGRPVYAISAESGEGVEALIRAIWQEVQAAALHQPGPVRDAGGYRVFRPLQERAGYQVRRHGDVYVLEGSEVPNLVVPRETTRWELASYLRERLRRTRWRHVLEDAGVKPGDVVKVGDVELEW